MATTGREVYQLFQCAGRTHIERGVVHHEGNALIAIQWDGWNKPYGYRKEDVEFFDSWQEAHAELLRRATEAVERAEEELRRVANMVEPMAEQQPREAER